jgi:hypothetical protein
VALTRERGFTGAKLAEAAQNAFDTVSGPFGRQRTLLERVWAGLTHSILLVIKFSGQLAGSWPAAAESAVNTSLCTTNIEARRGLQGVNATWLVC